MAGDYTGELGRHVLVWDYSFPSSNLSCGMGHLGWTGKSMGGVVPAVAAAKAKQRTGLYKRLRSQRWY